MCKVLVHFMFSLKMEFIMNRKGNNSLVHDGYFYRKKRVNKDSSEVWQCVNEKKGCKGKLACSESKIISATDHSCVPDVAAADVRVAMSRIKKRVREESNTLVPQIFQEELEPLQNRGLEIITNIPQFHNVKGSLYSLRRRELGIVKDPIDAMHINLPEELMKSSDGSPFLLADLKYNGDRIIIFCSKRGKNIIKEKKNFFMDGTFRSCPKQFLQIYSIHVDLGSGHEETNIVPVIFALLPNKQKETYKKMLNTIVNSIPEWSPHMINVDFEASSIEALREVFPNATIHGCFFHFSQCLWRKVQEIGLTKLYRECEEVRQTIRRCAALAFLKIEDIDEGWLNVHSNAPENDKLTQFLDYFIEQWIDNPHVPLQTWNCYGLKHRTTNAVEGWHSKLNTIVGKTNPRVLQLINVLKKESENSDFKIARSELNLESKRRKMSYIKIDDRLRRATQVYQESRDVCNFIKNVAYIIKFD